MGYQDELSHARFSGGMLLLGGDTALNKDLGSMSTDDLKRARQAEQNKVYSLDGDIKVRLTQYENAKKTQADLDAKAAAAKTEYENAVNKSRNTASIANNTAEQMYGKAVFDANNAYNDSVIRAKAAYEEAVKKAAQIRDKAIEAAKKQKDRVAADVNSNIGVTLKRNAMNTAQQNANHNREKVIQARNDYDNAIREREAYANHIKKIDAELRMRKG